MSLPAYALPESERKRYKIHGIARIDFRYVGNVVSSLGCLIDFEQLRKYNIPRHAWVRKDHFKQLRKYDTPRHAWVRKDHPSKPCVIIASERVKSVPEGALYLGGDSVLGLEIFPGETQDGRRGILLSAIEKI